MYFKKLELVGFKSFSEKTTLHFEPGITAIVGPNGCGKSNIFDAIRWVLGEQSVKALRGSDMQDVIFNGSDSKEPLSMAEVTLTLDNTKRLFPVDHDEVAIGRRIFRSGESEYLLNKTSVRLKDILDLLMGTGIGAESYSLVEQGKIDIILSSKPEDRRLVFDEASGIIKYKVQKKEALRKLEETQANLLRVNDIITEVKRQIGSLERQANKARKFKETFEELKSKEINLAILQKKTLGLKKEDIINQLSELESQEIGLIKLIQEQESKIIGDRNELRTQEVTIMNIKNQILNLENLTSSNKERIIFNQERISELEETYQYLKTQIEQTQNRLSLDEEKLNKVKEEHTVIKKGIDEKTQLLKEKEVQLDSINSSIKISLESVARTKRDILELVTKIADVKNGIVDSTSKQQIHLARKKRLEIEKAKINEEKTSVEDELNKINQGVENLERNFTDLNLKISEIKKELELQDSSLNQVNSDIQDLERRSLALHSQKELLEKLRATYDGLGESMNALVYLDKLPKEKTTGLMVRIKDYLNLSEEEKNILGFANLKLSGEAKSVDLDTQKINEKINQLNQDLESLRNIKTEKENHIEKLNQESSNLQNTLRNEEMILVKERALYQTILEEFNKLKEEEEITILELSDIEKELAILEEKIAHLQSNLSALDKEQKTAEDSISKEQNSISLNSQLKEETLVSIAKTKTELEALNKRVFSDETTLKILQDTYVQDKESLLNILKQIKDTETKRESLEIEIKSLGSKIVEGQKDLQNQADLLKEAEDKYQQISITSNEVVKKIELDRVELDKLKNKLYQLQMQNKDVDFKYLSIKDRLFGAYKVDLDIVGEQGLSLENNENILGQEIQRLKEKIDSYGAVNLIAIEEYDELKKRYDFLTQQQNDLALAKESLHEAILKINRTAKKIFLDTFEKVCVEFRNYSRLLFNGGDAQVFLIDEQDPLESGIEIICRPPGKKLQNILLLSGGEKALSAIALIFAIFKVKPAPFCVLDEIDAALDEANIDRFSRLLQEFAKGSQFIVITHNKRTIANADVMYGITMEESGISRIVSVKFAKDKVIKEPDAVVPEPV